MNATEAAVSTLLLGHDGEWWDGWMLVSLGIAAVVAAFVVAFTTGSVKVHKREAAAASAALERYKLETTGKVAEAASAGIAAGEKAGHAQSDVDAAKIELAKQETLTARATAEAAKATERAAEANLKTENLRKQNLDLESVLAPRTLEQMNSPEPLRAIPGITDVIESLAESEPGDSLAK
jgi:hypothetical protein